MIKFAQASCLFILLFLAIALFGIFYSAFKSDQVWAFDPYYLSITWFTLKQAFLSTFFSVGIGLILAKALQMVHFRFKKQWLAVLKTIFILPTFIIIPTFILVYGKTGWLNHLFIFFNLPFTFSIYGLHGILMAHVFLNLPFATLFCFLILSQISDEQKQLADSLGFSHWHRFKWLEWALIKKQLLSLSATIFMLCFTSFAIILTLGGGPKATTIEVALYQAIRDLDYASALILTCIQIGFSLLFLSLFTHFSLIDSAKTSEQSNRYFVFYPLWQKRIAGFIIVIFSCYLALPLCALVIQGILAFKAEFLTFALLHAFALSTLIALCAAFLTLFWAILFIDWITQLKLSANHNKNRLWVRLVLQFTQLIFIFSPLLIASGLFLIFYPLAEQLMLITLLMIVLNSLFALPFVFKQLDIPLSDQLKRYQFLSQTLHLPKWRFVYLALYLPFKKEWLDAFKLAFILSIGDFSLIIYFGQRNFATLTYYLYSLIAHYRFQEALSIAFLFYLFILFFLSLGSKKQI